MEDRYLFKAKRVDNGLARTKQMNVRLLGMK